MKIIAIAIWFSCGLICSGDEKFMEYSSKLRREIPKIMLDHYGGDSKVDRLLPKWKIRFSGGTQQQRKAFITVLDEILSLTDIKYEIVEDKPSKPLTKEEEAAKLEEFVKELKKEKLFDEDGGRVDERVWSSVTIVFGTREELVRRIKPQSRKKSKHILNSGDDYILDGLWNNRFSRCQMFFETSPEKAVGDFKKSYRKTIISVLGFPGYSKFIKGSIFYSRDNALHPFDKKVIEFGYKHIPLGAKKKDIEDAVRKEWEN